MSNDNKASQLMFTSLLRLTVTLIQTFGTAVLLLYKQNDKTGPEAI